MVKQVLQAFEEVLTLDTLVSSSIWELSQGLLGSAPQEAPTLIFIFYSLRLIPFRASQLSESLQLTSNFLAWLDCNYLSRMSSERGDK